MAERPKLFKIDDEMRRWCALLERDVSAWPNVSSKPMFGLTGFYRDETIFAAIPRTRAMETARSVLIKLRVVRDKRLKRTSGPGADWITFELQSPNDISEALRWLEQAYTSAPDGNKAQ